MVEMHSASNHTGASVKSSRKTLTRNAASAAAATRSSRRPLSTDAIHPATGADSATPTSIAALHRPAAASP